MLLINKKKIYNMDKLLPVKNTVQNKNQNTFWWWLISGFVFLIGVASLMMFLLLKQENESCAIAPVTDSSPTAPVTVPAPVTDSSPAPVPDSPPPTAPVPPPSIVVRLKRVATGQYLGYDATLKDLGLTRPGQELSEVTLDDDIVHFNVRDLTRTQDTSALYYDLPLWLEVRGNDRDEEIFLCMENNTLRLGQQMMFLLQVETGTNTLQLAFSNGQVSNGWELEVMAGMAPFRPQFRNGFERNESLGLGINYASVFDAPNVNAKVNADGFFEFQETGSFNEAHIDLLVNTGKFQHIRLPVRWDTHMSGFVLPGQQLTGLLDPLFVTRIQDVVWSLVRRSFSVILTVDNYDGYTSLTSNGDSLTVSTSLYDHPGVGGERNRFYKLWDQLGTAFRHFPQSVLFEMLNEPHGNLSTTIFNEMIGNCLSRMRQKNPYRACIVGGGNYNELSELSALQRSALDFWGQGNSIILTFHYYYNEAFTRAMLPTFSGGNPLWTQSVLLDVDSVTQDLTLKLTTAADLGFPLHCGAYGAFWGFKDQQSLDAAKFLDSSLGHSVSHLSLLSDAELQTRNSLRVTWVLEVTKVLKQFECSRSYFDFFSNMYYQPSYGIYDHTGRGDLGIGWNAAILNALA